MLIYRVQWRTYPHPQQAIASMGWRTHSGVAGCASVSGATSNAERSYTAAVLDELRIAVIIPAYNEAVRLRSLIGSIPRDLVDDIIVINDESTDGTGDVGREFGALVIDHPVRTGPGPAIRDALDLVRDGAGCKADVVVVMAANGKHDPVQIIDLVRPIVEERYDLVRGSRFVDGGMHVHMPWHRLQLIKLFTVLTRLALRQRITDATGGYQAYRLSVLEDPAINLHQPWLGRYEVETYLMAKTIMRGYRWKEVPVNITYPESGTYTRARVIRDWWGYFRPILLLRLRLKH
ncbi:MAG TPA: glycosyltransferase family 2 protein [Rugosimonospora sp.]|nr:glycosyltransferase family 2 protein [Rugosimonospora sp.]